MFGGVGLYFGDQFFGIVAFDRLWFKVDLDDSEELKVWAMRSVAVARRAKQKSSLKQSPEKLSINETSHSRPARLFRLRPRDVQEGVVP